MADKTTLETALFRRHSPPAGLWMRSDPVLVDLRSALWLVSVEPELGSLFPIWIYERSSEKGHGSKVKRETKSYIVYSLHKQNEPSK